MCALAGRVLLAATVDGRQHPSRVAPAGSPAYEPAQHIYARREKGSMLSGGRAEWTLGGSAHPALTTSTVVYKVPISGTSDCGCCL